MSPDPRPYRLLLSARLQNCPPPARSFPCPTPLRVCERVKLIGPVREGALGAAGERKAACERDASDVATTARDQHGGLARGCRERKPPLLRFTTSHALQHTVVSAAFSSQSLFRDSSCVLLSTHILSPHCLFACPIFTSVSRLPHFPPSSLPLLIASLMSTVDRGV